jgi:hypothetical protein
LRVELQTVEWRVSQILGFSDEILICLSPKISKQSPDIHHLLPPSATTLISMSGSGYFEMVVSGTISK